MYCLVNRRRRIVSFTKLFSQLCLDLLGKKLNVGISLRELITSKEIRDAIMKSQSIRRIEYQGLKFDSIPIESGLIIILLNHVEEKLNEIKASIKEELSVIEANIKLFEILNYDKNIDISPLNYAIDAVKTTNSIVDESITPENIL